MALKQFEFGFVLNVIDRLSPVLQRVEQHIEHLNESVKNTQRFREYGQNLAIAGAGMIAAGAAVGYGLRSAVMAAGAFQAEWTHVATAMNDGANQARNQAQAMKLVEEISTKTGLSAIQESNAYYIARSNMLNHVQALAAITTASKLAIATTATLSNAQAANEPTTRLLTTVYQNFGDHTKSARAQIAAFGDTMAKLQTQYAFADISEINYAMQYAVPLAKSAGISFNQMSAALALLSESGLHGAEAGTAFQELVTKLTSGQGQLRNFAVLNAQGGLDLQRTLLRLKSSLAGLAPYQQALTLHQFGLSERSITGATLLIDKVNQFGDVVANLNNSQGALGAAFAIRSKGWDIQVGRLAAAWENFKQVIGNSLLGPLGKTVGYLGAAFEHVTAFASAHPKLVKMVTVTTAIGAALLIVVGGALALVGAIGIAASFIPAGLAVVSAAVGIASGAFGILATAAAAAWAAITWPIALVIAAIAAFGIAVYEIYEHWAGISQFFRKLGAEMYSAGANLMASLAKGMWSTATAPIRAVAHVAESIWSHLPHSPAKEGPLRNLHRVQIVETIAQTIRPGPAIAAMRRTAAALALSAPLIAAPMLAAPAFAARAPMASSAAGGAAIVINLSQEFRIEGGDPAAVIAALRAHAHEAVNIIQTELKRRERTEF